MNEMFVVQGKDLIGLKYKPLFSYFAENNNSFHVLNGDFVTTEDGTGIVHMAPAFGEDDHKLCVENNIPIVCPVNDDGCFNHSIPNLEYNLNGINAMLSLDGKQVFETNDDIIKYLKSKDLWLKTEEYIHNYPHCWRTDTPLIYKVVNSWYVNVTSIKDKLLEKNDDINWIPNHIKDGVFGKWLSNTRDWSISRNRFWGCPVPVWKSNNPKYPRIDVYGSIEDIVKDFGDYYKKMNGVELIVNDLHRPFIDTLTRPNPDDPSQESMMVRVEDVLDCWFESGSMPFASIHYPFEYKIGDNIVRTAEENQRWFHEHFPADFIVEYIAQTRGWFYTLTVLGVALFDKAPFKNCICHGVVLDTNGEKLSKRLKNYPDPIKMFDTYGSDAMRFAMLRSPVMIGREINIDVDGNFIRNVSRLVIMAFWNAFSFLHTYMKADKIFDFTDKVKNLYSFESTNTTDLYLFSELHELVKTIKNAMDNYDTITACNKFEEFLDSMNNWYIRRNRQRFWYNIRIKDPVNIQKVRLIVAKFEHMLSDNKTDELRKIADMAFINSRSNDILDIIDPNSENFDHRDIENFTYYEDNFDEQKISSVIADIVLNNTLHPWRMRIEESEIVLIDKDKQFAFNTLYTTLLTLCKAVSPLLPCISESIYMNLTSNQE